MSVWAGETASSRRGVGPVGPVVGGRVGLFWRVVVVIGLLVVLLAGAALDGVLTRGPQRPESSVAVSERVAPRPGTGARVRAFGREGLLSLPVAALGPVSAAVGSSDPAYRVTRGPGGLGAESPGQRLRLRFTSQGASVTVGSSTLSLRLQASGYGDVLRPVSTLAPRLAGPRVVYGHTGITEWYANGPLGLEQGFTVARPPAVRAPEPLSLAVWLGGNVRGVLADGGQAVEFWRSGRLALRYRGLVATDARGRLLRSWLTLRARRLVIHVGTRGARYPIRIDPFVQQGGPLVTDDGDPTVALSSDGTTALVGGGVGGLVFTRSGSVWTQQANLANIAGVTVNPPQGNTSSFGVSVSLSADGNTALVSGYWLFVRTGSTWTEQTTLTGNTEQPGVVAADGALGALSANGNTAVIGTADTGGDAGAWVFTRSGSTWTQEGPEITQPGVLSGTLAISGDGNTALFGDPGYDTSTGEVFVYTQSGGAWTQQGPPLTDPDGSDYEDFGAAVALSTNGNTALIGEPAGNAVINKTAKAWVFTRSGSTWTQPPTQLMPDSGISEDFGRALALSGDGNTAMIGGITNDQSAPTANGGVGVFTNTNGTWSQQGADLPPPPNTEIFGSQIALSTDGSTALIADLLLANVSGLNGEGEVFVFGQPAPSVSISAVNTFSASLVPGQPGCEPHPGRPGDGHQPDDGRRVRGGAGAGGRVVLGCVDARRQPLAGGTRRRRVARGRSLADVLTDVHRRRLRARHAQRCGRLPELLGRPGHSRLRHDDREPGDGCVGDG